MQSHTVHARRPTDQQTSLPQHMLSYLVDSADEAHIVSDASTRRNRLPRSREEINPCVA